MLILSIGTTSNGYPMIVFKPGCFNCFPKAQRALTYYKETCDRVIEKHNAHNIQPGHLIMDWTARSAHIEMLANLGYPCHHLIYHERVPDKPQINEITGVPEDKIPLDLIPMFVKEGVQKNIVHYAHQIVTNKITLGAYLFRLFVEKGRVRGLNASLLNGIMTENFEKEFFRRTFFKIKRKEYEVLSLDSKEDFKDLYGFSPDLLDTVFQFFYMIYVIYDVKPDRTGLGKLVKKKNKKPVDNNDKLWKFKHLFKV